MNDLIWHTAQEASDIFEVNKATIYKWIYRKKVECKKIDKLSGNKVSILLAIYEDKTLCSPEQFKSESQDDVVWATPLAAAALLKTSKATIYRRISAGILEHVGKDGRKISKVQVEIGKKVPSLLEIDDGIEPANVRADYRGQHYKDSWDTPALVKWSRRKLVRGLIDNGVSDRVILNKIFYPIVKNEIKKYIDEYRS